MGKEFSYGAWADIKPIDRLLISASYSYVRSDDLETDERLFSQSVFWTRFSLQISRELSVRLIMQYNDRYNAWNADPLITYRINSFTVFYLGSTLRYADFGTPEEWSGGWRLANRQYFMKLQYLFQF